MVKYLIYERESLCEAGDVNKGGSPQPVAVTRRGFLVGASCVLCSAATAALSYRIGTARERETARRLTSDGFSGTASPTKTNTQRRRAQPNALFRVRTDKPYVALTFDDGPDVRYTATVLDLLADRNVTATFFMIGVNALAHPELARRAVSEGHTAGNHTYDHRELELLRPPAIEVEIEKGQAALRRIGLESPPWFRPPKGYTDHAVGVLADADRYRTIFWDVAVERYIDHQPIAQGVDQLLAEVRPGSIILAHDGGHVVGIKDRPKLSRARTVEALPLLLDGLAKRGFEVMSVDALLQRTS